MVRTTQGNRMEYGCANHVEARHPKFTIGFSQRVFGCPTRWWTPVRCALHMGIAWSTTAPTHVEAQNPKFKICSPTSFRVTHLLVGHLRGARYAGEPHGVRLHQLMWIHVKAQNRNCAIGFSQRLFGWPTRWWATCVLRATQGKRMEYDCTN